MIEINNIDSLCQVSLPDSVASIYGDTNRNQGSYVSKSGHKYCCHISRNATFYIKDCLHIIQSLHFGYHSISKYKFYNMYLSLFNLRIFQQINVKF